MNKIIRRSNPIIHINGIFQTFQRYKKKTNLHSFNLFIHNSFISHSLASRSAQLQISIRWAIQILITLHSTVYYKSVREKKKKNAFVISYANECCEHCRSKFAPKNRTKLKFSSAISMARQSSRLFLGSPYFEAIRYTLHLPHTRLNTFHTSKGAMNPVNRPHHSAFKPVLLAMTFILIRVHFH